MRWELFGSRFGAEGEDPLVMVGLLAIIRASTCEDKVVFVSREEG